MRLDRYLTGCLDDLSRSAIANLIRAEHVRVDGQAVKTGRVLKGGERIDVAIPAAEPLSVEPEAIPLSILHEDDEWIVLDKPPGMPTHPSPGHPRGTLVNALAHHCGGLPLPPGPKGEDPDVSPDARARPGIIHRLDMDTSGVIVAAKTAFALRRIAAQFAARTVAKAYTALVHGLPKEDEGVIDAPLGRHPKEHRRVIVQPRSGLVREALTSWRVEARWVVPGTQGFAMIRAEPKTGRTHQIRVHLKWVGHPLIADGLYGSETEFAPRDVFGKRLPDGEPDEPILTRHALHARQLAFDHPRTGKRLTFTCPPPPDFHATTQLLTRATNV